MTPNPYKLPDECATWHPTTRQPMTLKRGRMGQTLEAWDYDVERFNNLFGGVSALQQQIMLMGSVFGWGSVVEKRDLGGWETGYDGKLIDYTQPDHD